MTADPAPMVHEGRLYVYSGHDEDDGDGVPVEPGPRRCQRRRLKKRTRPFRGPHTSTHLMNRPRCRWLPQSLNLPCPRCLRIHFRRPRRCLLERIRLRQTPQKSGCPPTRPPRPRRSCWASTCWFRRRSCRRGCSMKRCRLCRWWLQPRHPGHRLGYSFRLRRLRRPWRRHPLPQRGRPCPGRHPRILDLHHASRCFRRPKGRLRRGSRCRRSRVWAQAQRRSC